MNCLPDGSTLHSAYMSRSQEHLSTGKSRNLSLTAVVDGHDTSSTPPPATAPLPAHKPPMAHGGALIKVNSASTLASPIRPPTVVKEPLPC